MDFFIHTVFENRHITLNFEDTKFFNNGVDGYESTISVIDFNSGSLDEIPLDEYIEIYPTSEDFIDEKIKIIIDRNIKNPYKDETYLLVL